MNLGVIEGTPNALHVLTQLEENADTNMKSGTSHSVASVAIRAPPMILLSRFEALINDSSAVILGRDQSHCSMIDSFEQKLRHGIGGLRPNV
jgi:hypothetical protein